MESCFRTVVGCVEIYQAVKNTRDQGFCSVENQLFAGDFSANMDETKAEMVQFTKRWT